MNEFAISLTFFLFLFQDLRINELVTLTYLIRHQIYTMSPSVMAHLVRKSHAGSHRDDNIKPKLSQILYILYIHQASLLMAIIDLNIQCVDYFITLLYKMADILVGMMVCFKSALFLNGQLDQRKVEITTKKFKHSNQFEYRKKLKHYCYTKFY